MLTAAVPEPSVLTLPKSPTCLSSSEGPPWFLPWGLKWGPAEVQPFELSPNWLFRSVSLSLSRTVSKQDIGEVHLHRHRDNHWKESEED